MFENFLKQQYYELQLIAMIEFHNTKYYIILVTRHDFKCKVSLFIWKSLIFQQKELFSQKNIIKQIKGIQLNKKLEILTTLFYFSKIKRYMLV